MFSQKKPIGVGHFENRMGTVEIWSTLCPWKMGAIACSLFQIWELDLKERKKGGSGDYDKAACFPVWGGV